MFLLNLTSCLVVSVVAVAAVKFIYVAIHVGVVGVCVDLCC